MPDSPPNPRIAAVIVAFSRLDLLRQSIDALRSQTRPVDEIVIVDQSSRDDIHAYLDAQPDIVLHRQGNLGSAGGFNTGIRIAVERGNDWVWILDEDGVARPDALEHLVACPHFGRDDTAYVVSRIVNRHGRAQQVPVLTHHLAWFDTVLDDGCVGSTYASWLGLLINARAVRRHGLPIREFFLWNEDLEFTDRITRSMNGYCAIRSVIVHYQKDDPFDPFNPGDFVKIGHGIRNRIGWLKVAPDPLPKKLYRIASASASCVGKVLRRKLPVKSLAWLASGLFTFWPKVEMLDSPPPAAARDAP
jgi:GT2 family glycosyltransferase